MTPGSLSLAWDAENILPSKEKGREGEDLADSSIPFKESKGKIPT